MSTESPEFKAASDEAWKEHVRAENAEHDRKAAGAAGGADDATTRIPPADFSSLVEMLTTQALVALGMMAHPASKKPEVQLSLARHFIDLLGIVEAKTTGHCTPDESSLLGGSLHYLRMSYIEVSKQANQPKN
jgi:hypothetical protein